MTDLDLYTTAQIRRLEWISDGCCNACDRIDHTMLEQARDFSGVGIACAPAHVGCSCCINIADEEFGARIGTDEDRARARRGSLSAEEHEFKNGHKHTIDIRQ